jgi:hypothetical protein
MLTPEQIKDQIEDKNFKNAQHVYDGHEVIIPKERLEQVFVTREIKKINYLTGNFDTHVLLTEEIRPEVKDGLRGQGYYNYQMIKQKKDIWSWSELETVGASFRFSRSSTAIMFKLSYL